MPANKQFYDAVRPLFGGRLSQHQVDGLQRIVEYGEEWGYDPDDIAYVLATVKHETGDWMQPIREGAHRFGPEYTDASAKRAVASIHAKGIISTNYALPSGPYGQSYYGRGLVQITWHANYEKFARILGVPLDQNPDLALEWDHALDILFLGMRDGVFTGKKLSDFKLPAEFKQARVIVNADSHKKWGGSERIDDRLARYARTFAAALRASQAGVSPEPTKDTHEVIRPAQRPENRTAEPVPAPAPVTPAEPASACPNSGADAPEPAKSAPKSTAIERGWEWLWPF